MVGRSSRRPNHRSDERITGSAEEADQRYGLAGLRLVRSPALSLDDSALRQILTQLGISAVFDVGAHVGEYATRLRNIGYRRRIVSFEPQSAAFLALAEKASRDPQWEAVRLALGDRVGEQELNISANSVSSSFLPVEVEMLEIETGLAQVKVETVPVTTLDQVHHRLVGCRSVRRDLFENRRSRLRA
jgi:FkbM family methyltransferase